MENLKIKVTINSSDNKQMFETNATYDKDKQCIYYTEKDKENTKVIYNYQEHVLKRDNKNIYLEYKFKQNQNTKGKLIIKDYNQFLNLEIFTIKLYCNSNNLEIKYKLNDEQYLFKIDLI